MDEVGCLLECPYWRKWDFCSYIHVQIQFRENAFPKLVPNVKLFELYISQHFEMIDTHTDRLNTGIHPSQFCQMQWKSDNGHMGYIIPAITWLNLKTVCIKGPVQSLVY